MVGLTVHLVKQLSINHGFPTKQLGDIKSNQSSSDSPEPEFLLAFRRELFVLLCFKVDQ